MFDVKRIIQYLDWNNADYQYIATTKNNISNFEVNYVRNYDILKLYYDDILATIGGIISITIIIIKLT